MAFSHYMCYNMSWEVINMTNIDKADLERIRAAIVRLQGMSPDSLIAVKQLAGILDSVYDVLEAVEENMKN